MAQIIKHRRGSLESVASATKRSGELLVVTGSAGITAANGDSLLFIGVDGSTVTAANKILQGTSVPNLTGASYDTSVDGIPFYDTNTNKLYILNKGGNVEIKASANTDGTGIVSGSSQIQIDGVTGFSTFSSSVDTRLDGLESFSSSLGDGFATDAELTAVSSAFDSTILALTTDDITEGSNLYFTDARVKTKLNAEGVISSSVQVNADSITNFDSNVKSKLNLDGVISSSAQVQIDSVSGFTAFSSSADSRLDTLEAAVGEGSNIDGRLSNLESFSGSQESKDATLATYTASVDQNLDAIHAYTSSLKTGISLDGANVTILGNLEVAGTQTIVDSTTVSIGDNIIELNGTGAANGGLLVKDVTAPNTVSGSLLWDSTNDYWKAGALGAEEKILLANGDGVVSGSAQIDLGGVTGDTDDVTEGSTNLYFTDARVKTKLNADGVISGSSQVTISETTGFTSYSGSVSASIAAAVAASEWDNINNKPAGIVSSSAQVVSYLDSQDVNLGGISGSSLDITGNAKIDGNLVLGGNITIGDASSDTISFGGEIASDIIPDPTNTYDLGSATNTFAEIHGTNIYGTVNGVVNATNGVISGSAQLLNVATDFGSGRVSGDNFGDVAGTSTFTGSFVGDGSGITGLSTTISVSGSDGSNDQVSLLDGAITFDGGTGVSTAVATDTVTISVQDASTSAKGIASFDADDFSVTSGNVSVKAGGIRATNLNADVAGTGISLNGVDNSIEVDYGSTAGTAVEGNTSLTVQGTSNEIEVTSGNVTLGAGGTVTIGLPNDVTIGNDLTVTNDLGVTGNVEITGNLSVLGTTTTIDSTTVQIGDNILELNIGGAQSTAGLQVTDATAPNTVSGSLLWDGTNDYWKAGPLGSEKEIARLNTSPTSNTVLKADANGLLVDSLITDDGTNVTISGTAELRINAATANSFVYFDSNKSLEAVTPANTGDVIQWNGSSFVASNEIDGGTF
jgi:hypothetical protein